MSGEITWVYAIAARTLFDDAGNILAVGCDFRPPYSGNDQWRDDPTAGGVVGHGPLPPGLYRIGPVYDDPHLGPHVMHLDPEGWDGGGRTVIRCHGDNSRGDASASDGCLILPPALRQALSSSAALLLVTA